MNRGVDARLFTRVALGVLACAVLARWVEVWQNTADLAHAWAVPALAAYLAWERRGDCPPGGPTWPRGGVARVLALAAAAGIVFCYMLARALLYSFPTWAAGLWLFSAAAWALALGMIALGDGPLRARHFAFPILFTANALPWMNIMNEWLVFPLRKGLAMLAAGGVELMGYPTAVSGMVVQVGAGQVGVDEACSGVRSLQTALMLSLFFGELLRLRLWRRAALVGIGIGLALLSNLGRTFFLTWQAAAQGPAAAERWHDAAGNGQMAFALGGLLLVAWGWSRFSPSSPRLAQGPRATQLPAETEPRECRYDARYTAVALAGLVLVLEIPLAGWFALAGPGETTMTKPWQVHFPLETKDYRVQNFTPYERELLRCDRYEAANWTGPDGKRRAGYWLEWQRGLIARDVVAMHKPEICLPGSGSSYVRSLPPVTLDLGNGVSLPFRVGEYRDARGVFQVFYLAWNLTHARSLVPLTGEDGAGLWAFRLREFAMRRGDFSARVVAFAIYDEPDAASAIEAFRSEARAMLALKSADF